MNKQYILFFVLLFPILIFGQNKPDINGGVSPCRLSLITELTDTIYFSTQCKCYNLQPDTLTNKIQVIYYCDSTTIRQVVSVKDGKKDSNFIEYYENGVLKTNGYYENGSLNDDYISYYENGKIKSLGVYTNGRFIGSKFKYWDSGNLAEIRTITADSFLLGHVLYLDELGQEITKEKFDKLWW